MNTRSTEESRIRVDASLGSLVTAPSEKYLEKTKGWLNWVRNSREQGTLIRVAILMVRGDEGGGSENLFGNVAKAG